MPGAGGSAGGRWTACNRKACVLYNTCTIPSKVEEEWSWQLAERERVSLHVGSEREKKSLWFGSVIASLF